VDGTSDKETIAIFRVAGLHAEFLGSKLSCIQPYPKFTVEEASETGILFLIVFAQSSNHDASFNASAPVTVCFESVSLSSSPILTEDRCGETLSSGKQQGA
jgi:hypothetical protein